MSPSQATQRRTRRLPAAIVVVAGIGVLLLSIVTAISFGPSDLSVGNVWDVLAHKLGFGPDPGLTPLRVATIWDLRLPRVLPWRRDHQRLVRVRHLLGHPRQQCDP